MEVFGIFGAARNKLEYVELMVLNWNQFLSKFIFLHKHLHNNEWELNYFVIKVALPEVTDSRLPNSIANFASELLPT